MILLCHLLVRIVTTPYNVNLKTSQCWVVISIQMVSCGCLQCEMRIKKPAHIDAIWEKGIKLVCLVCCSMRSAHDKYCKAVSNTNTNSLMSQDDQHGNPPFISTPAVAGGCWDLCCGGRASLPSGLQQGVATETPASDTHSTFMYHE